MNPEENQAIDSPETNKDMNEPDNPSVDITNSDNNAQKQTSFRAKTKILLLVSICFLALVVTIGVRLIGSLRLSVFDAPHYSLQVPRSYSITEESDFVRFTENTGNPSTRSFIVVRTQNYATPPTDESRQRVLELFVRNIPQLIGQSSDAAQRVENISSQQIIHRERDAFRITADLIKDDKRAKLDILVVAGGNAIFMVGVAAHEEDIALTNASNKIVTSLTLYE